MNYYLVLSLCQYFAFETYHNEMNHCINQGVTTDELADAIKRGCMKVDEQ